MQPTHNPNPIYPLSPDSRPQVQRPEQSVGGQTADQLRSSELAVAPAAEQAPVQPSGAPTQAPAVSQQSTQPVAATPQAATQPQPVATVPPAAGGKKLEKEWVDRADAIIHTTAQDPHAEEEAHEELSALYLKQRFNLDIKRSDPQ